MRTPFGMRWPGTAAGKLFVAKTGTTRPSVLPSECRQFDLTLECEEAGMYAGDDDFARCGLFLSLQKSARVRDGV